MMMVRKIRKFFRKNYDQKIDPDEIFMDSTNLPGFDTYQFEGRIEKPILDRTFWLLGLSFFAVIIVFLGQTWNIQINKGEMFAELSSNNRLRHTLVFSDRGIIYDKNNVALAWNEVGEEEFSLRKYTETPGFASLLGYVSYPKKDSAGFYYDETIEGVDGIEQYFNNLLQGENGLRIVETDALNSVVSENITRRPDSGKNINLTIDADIQENLHKSLAKIVEQAGFAGGGAVVMDIYTGDLLALTNYPEYDSNVLTAGKDKEAIRSYVNDDRNPFLNRVVHGLYTPGSIVKPYMAIGALQEGVISKTDKIVSRGTLEVPNPYDPSNPSIFTDWKAHGAVDVKAALAYSSNIYFYIVGGGYDDIEGLGIRRMEEYFRKFGFGEEIKTDIFSGVSGTIPNPEWKEEQFDDIWRLGDTYFTAIGQYGFQVAPIQVIRAISAIANNGMLIEPNIIADSRRTPQISFIEGVDDDVLQTVREGIRDATLFGTSRGLNYEDFKIAAKTGTAELGVSKQKVNSWITGFWPYDDPKYAFVIFLERGDRANLIGGVAVARGFFDWLKFNKPEYLY